MSNWRDTAAAASAVSSASRSVTRVVSPPPKIGSLSRTASTTCSGDSGACPTTKEAALAAATEEMQSVVQDLPTARALVREASSLDKHRLERQRDNLLTRQNSLKTNFPGLFRSHSC